MMNIRPATIGDLAILFEVHRSVFRSHIEKLWGWDEDWQRGNFASEFTAATTSVIEVDGQIAGYIQTLDQDDQMYVQNIAISARFQCKGIGTQLLKELQSNATARKMSLHLGVFRTNSSAQRLYKRLGFHNIDETRTHINMLWVAPKLENEGDEQERD